MEFGIWYDFRNPPQWRRPWGQLYGETLEQARWADTLGFHSIWLSEHHFTDEGYLPAMFPMLAALAERTQNVRLGTAIMLLPLHHPLRVAEDAAVVDIISGGRLDLAVAPGYRKLEFQALDIPSRQRGARTDEALEILQKAWTGEPFQHTGRHFDLPRLTIQPTPLQQPHPPLWIGGASAAAAKRAASFGCNFMPDSGAQREVYDIYATELESRGRKVSDFRIASNRVIYVCDDPEKGWEDVKEHYLYVFNVYRKWYAEVGDHPEFGTMLENADELDRDLHLVGTPEMVIEALERQRERFGLDHLVFWARPPGLSIEKSSRSLELFANEVLPHFA